MPKVFTDPAVLGYHAPGHPEAPFRVGKTAERLKSAGMNPSLPSEKASADDVRLVHASDHFELVKTGRYADADTPHHPGIEKLALISLAGAFSAAASAAAGDPGFSLMRPPGHHAGKGRVAGFCYFNNLAAACQKLIVDKKAARIAILDIDVHHGDGTEDIVAGRAEILFCSLHQVPLYPGSGLKSGGNIINHPLAPGTSEAPYLKTLETGLRALLDFKPDILAVSAGFDTYKECPIAGLKLDKPSYRRIGRLLAETKLKRFAVLEGGYAEDMPLLIENFLDGFFS